MRHKNKLQINMQNVEPTMILLGGMGPFSLLAKATRSIVEAFPKHHGQNVRYTNGKVEDLRLATSFQTYKHLYFRVAHAGVHLAQGNQREVEHVLTALMFHHFISAKSLTCNFGLMHSRSQQYFQFKAN